MIMSAAATVMPKSRNGASVESPKLVSTLALTSPVLSTVSEALSIP